MILVGEISKISVMNPPYFEPGFNEFVRELCHSAVLLLLPLEIHRTPQQVLPAARLAVEIQFPEPKISDSSEGRAEA